MMNRPVNIARAAYSVKKKMKKIPVDFREI